MIAQQGGCRAGIRSVPLIRIARKSILKYWQSGSQAAPKLARGRLSI